MIQTFPNSPDAGASLIREAVIPFFVG